MKALTMHLQLFQNVFNVQLRWIFRLNKYIMSWFSTFMNQYMQGSIVTVRNEGTVGQINLSSRRFWNLFIQVKEQAHCK